VVAENGELVVNDARKHAVLRHNLGVVELGVVAYAGVPLRTRDGLVLGSFCAFDSEPRTWSAEDIDLLRDLASAVESEIALRLEVERRTKSEARLLRVKRRYKALAERSLDPLWEVDSAGRFTYLNAAAKLKFGLRKGELCPFLGTADLEKLTCRGEQIHKMEHGVSLPEGGSATMETNVIGFVRNSERAAVGISRDVTQRVQQARELEVEVKNRTRDLSEALARSRALELRFQTLIERTPHPVAMFDDQMRYLHYSHRWIEDYKLAGEDLTGRSHYDVFPSLPERWKEHHARALAGESLTSEEDSFLRADGKREWIRWELVPWHNAAGEVGGIIMMTEVLTERRRERGELLAQYQKLEQVAGKLRQAQIAAKLVHWAWNPINDHITIGPYRGKEEITLPLESVLTEVKPERRKAILNTLKKAALESKPATLEFSLEDGRSILARGLRKGDIVVGIAQDVSELRNLELQLRHAQKMEALGVLAGGVAHDFNNILCGILLPAEMALDRLNSDHEIRPELEEILTSGQRAQSLVRQLLLFSRQRKMDVQVIEVNSVLLRLERMLKRLLPSRIELRTQLAEGSNATVEIDPSALEQVITNLVVNARDAISQHGVVTVTTEVKDCSRSGERSVVISVSDTGHGIPDAVTRRIFDPFFTTKGAGEGTGLGLSVCHRIVKDAGGKLSLEDSSDLGTCFTVTLPTSEEQSVRPVSYVDPVPRAKGNETVALVEDDDTLRRVLRKLLRSLGYKVEAFCTAQEALSELHSLNPALLITDSCLPSSSGRELASQARHRIPQLAVLIICGNGSAGLELAQDLDDPVLVKPFTKSSFAVAVRQAIEGLAYGKAKKKRFSHFRE
jgi:PAS domain S-box-containing protein